MSGHEGRLFLTRRTKRRLRSLAIGLITVVVIGVAGLVVIRRERAPADPVTPAEAGWARRAHPLLVAVDRLVNRHDALVAATTATGRQAIRPTAALLGSIRTTLRQLRKLPPAPLRLSPFRSESIDALENALRAYGDYAAGSRSGDPVLLSRADREWDAALGDVVHLDRLVATTLVPSAVKRAGSLVDFVAYEAALEAARPQLRTARAVEELLLRELRAGHQSSATRRLANRSASGFSALSVQASGLPVGDDDISSLNLEYLNALHHAVLGANEVVTGLQTSNSALLHRAARAYATGDSTYLRFLHDLYRYGTTLTATAAATS